MVESDHFLLKWENHSTILISKMRHLLNEDKFVDVEMNVEGELIKAHRLVLCASSQVFEDLFSQQKGTTVGQEIDLEGVRAIDMKALLQFMYEGEVTVPQDQLPLVLKIGAALQIDGLIDAYQQYKNDIQPHEKLNYHQQLKDSSSSKNEVISSPTLTEPILAQMSLPSEPSRSSGSCREEKIINSTGYQELLVTNSSSASKANQEALSEGTNRFDQTGQPMSSVNDQSLVNPELTLIRDGKLTRMLREDWDEELSEGGEDVDSRSNAPNAAKCNQPPTGSVKETTSGANKKIFSVNSSVASDGSDESNHPSTITTGSTAYFQSNRSNKRAILKTHDDGPSGKRNRPSTDDKEAAGNDTLNEFEKDEGEQVSEHDENINDDRSSTHYTSILEHGAINSSKKSSDNELDHNPTTAGPSVLSGPRPNQSNKKKGKILQNFGQRTDFTKNVFKQTSDLEQNLFGDFGRNLAFACTSCAYQTNNKFNLKRHLIGVHGVDPSNLPAHVVGYLFPCELCPFRSRYKSGLLMHIKDVHNGN